MSILRDHAAMLGRALDSLGDLEEPLHAAAASIARSLGSGGKVLAAGNGGSAAEAQHFTAEFLGRLHPSRERPPLAAVVLHGDASAVTAISNDYGYDRVFSRQVEAMARPADVLVVFSTSGRSANLVNAVEVATAAGIDSIGLLGPGQQALHTMCTHVLSAPSDSLQTIQECHLVLLHALVEQTEELMGYTDFPASP